MLDYGSYVSFVALLNDAWYTSDAEYMFLCMFIYLSRYFRMYILRQQGAISHVRTWRTVAMRSWTILLTYLRLLRAKMCPLANFYATYVLVKVVIVYIIVHAK